MTEQAASKRTFGLFAIYYFVYASQLGIATIYLPPVFVALGLSGKQLGAVLGIPPLVGCVAPLVWGHLADRTGHRSRVLRLISLGAVGGFLGLYFANDTVSLAAVLIVIAAFRSGMPPLVDALALAKLDSRQYVRARVCESIGWISTTFLFGRVFAGTTVDGTWAIRIPHLCLAVAAAVPWLLPTEAPVSGPRPTVGDTFRLLRDRRLQTLLLPLMIYWVGMGPFDTMLALHAESLGFSASAAGDAFGVAVIAEIVVMTIASRASIDLFGSRRWSAKRVLLFVMASTALRWWLTAIVTHLWAFLAIQAIHGLSFGAFVIVSIREVRALVPERLRATGQALLFSIVGGVGGTLGALIAGSMYDVGGTALAFKVGAGAVAVAFAAMLFHRETVAAEPAMPERVA
ncbi:MAG: Nucleoside:H+ symporter:Major facilitator superfamily [Myxococcales bacterium]|nr:Nucleoside:H+ symporter:Major facilitator superfamily [Myxococcales bacterium]